MKPSESRCLCLRLDDLVCLLNIGDGAESNQSDLLDGR
jgi:hypothetical protein